MQDKQLNSEQYQFIALHHDMLLSGSLKISVAAEYVVLFDDMPIAEAIKLYEEMKKD